jgi:hypothetical protein
LDDAQQMTKRLAAEGRIEAVGLAQRIEAARLEIEAIRVRRARGVAEDFDPNWTKDIPWRRSA